MLALRRAALFTLFVALNLLLCSFAHAGDDWQPVTPDELKMTSAANAPGAPAIYLYRQVDRDDNTGREHNYDRIKIFTEEGRKYADVEIPFDKGSEQIQIGRASCRERV